MHQTLGEQARAPRLRSTPRAPQPGGTAGVYGPAAQRAARRQLVRQWTELSAVRGAPVQRVLAPEARAEIGLLTRPEVLARIRGPRQDEEEGEIATAWLAARGSGNDTDAWVALLRDAGLLDDETDEEREHDQHEAQVVEEQEPLSAEAQRERIARDAQQRAVEFLTASRAYLEQGVQGEDAALLGRVFGDGEVLDVLRQNLARMSEYLAATTLRIAYVPDERTSVNAYTLQGAITLQTPFFDRLDDDARRNTVVHETVHAALNVPDYAYTTERLIDLLSTGTALRNPDSYVWFLSGLLEDRREPRGNFQDAYPDGMADARRAEVRKAVGLMVSAFRQTNLLFVQAHDDAAAAVREARPVGNNTVFCIQEMKRVFTGASRQWNPQQPNEEMVNGLGKMAQMAEYLLGGLVAPVPIRDAGDGPVAWARAGQAPATLALPPGLAGAELYRQLMTAYVRDLLSPTRGERWKSFQALMVNVSRHTTQMDDYRGTAMSFPDPQV